MNFVDLVMKARPQIKENSAKAYATSLKLFYSLFFGETPKPRNPATPPFYFLILKE